MCFYTFPFPPCYSYTNGRKVKGPDGISSSSKKICENIFQQRKLTGLGTWSGNYMKKDQSHRTSKHREESHLSTGPPPSSKQTALLAWRSAYQSTAQTTESIRSCSASKQLLNHYSSWQCCLSLKDQTPLMKVI